VVGDRIVSNSRWVDEHGEPGDETFRVFTIRDGLIVDWQDCSSRRAAERFARR